MRLHQIDPEGAADGAYAVTVATGVITGLTEVNITTHELPLTATVNGVPELVWNENDELVLTEVPL